VRPTALRTLALLELQGQYAHADQVGAWMRSKLSATTARTPTSIVPLAAQSRDEPVPYSLPANTTSGVPRPCTSWPHPRWTSVRRSARARTRRPRAGHHQVGAAGCWRRAAHHTSWCHGASRRSLKSAGCTHLRHQVLRGRAGLGDVAGGEMWSVVTESPSTASTRAPRRSPTARCHGHAVEVRRVCARKVELASHL